MDLYSKGFKGSRVRVSCQVTAGRLYAGTTGFSEVGMPLSADSFKSSLNPCITLGPLNPQFWSCVYRLVSLCGPPHAICASGFFAWIKRLKKNFQPDLFVHFYNIGQSGFIVGGLLCPSIIYEFLLARHNALDY